MPTKMIRGGGVKLLDGEKIFIEDLWHDEVRDGFLVTAKRKRLWNIQLNLIDEFARICKKYNLRWFAYAGTLLGAVRHKGFIPWDDDVDILMLRPDYEKFQAVAPVEIKEPYFFDPWYNYRLEGEENISEPDLPLITQVQRQTNPWVPFFPLIKIRDSRTSMIEYFRPQINEGVWIDIFPFDPVPPFNDETQARNFEIAREILFIIARPDLILDALNNGQNLLLSRNNIENFLAMPHKQKILTLEKFLLETFPPKANFLGATRTFCITNERLSFALKNFSETVYLPFEKMEIPAPKGYEDCLTSTFGENWRTPIFTHSHVHIFSAEVPSTEFFKKFYLS